MHEVLKSGGIDITERSLRTFLDKAYCREERLPIPPGPWCWKKEVIRSEPNEGAWGFAKQGSGVRRTAVRHGGFRDADNECNGGWPTASVSLQRPRTAMAQSAEPIGGDASFEERGAAGERKLARLAVARSAPPWTSSLANRQKKRPVPRRMVRGPTLKGIATRRREGREFRSCVPCRLDCWFHLQTLTGDVRGYQNMTL